MQLCMLKITVANLLYEHPVYWCAYNNIGILRKTLGDIYSIANEPTLRYVSVTN